MASFVLLSWPLVALALFARLAAPAALVTVVVVPYLFLPEAYAIDLPGLPDLNKSIVISLGLLLCLLLFQQKIRAALGTPEQKPAYPWLKTALWGCLTLMVAGAFLTTLGNGEALRFGPRYIPPAQTWDAISLTGQRMLVLLPFWCAARYMAHPDMHRTLLKALAFAVLAYSVLMLVEIRLSPQLHNWVYGYHQHSFLQHIRDGYRPKVFLQHGIWVGFLVFMGLMAAAALWRASGHKGWLFATVWIFTVLLLSENLAALAIAVMLLAAFFLIGARLQKMLILGISVVVLLFPALRQGQLVPTQTIVSLAAMVDAERAGSLAFRLGHEDKLLDRAKQKPLIGWGGWGRSQVYDEDGRDISISEGRWIQTLGRFGWIGYIALFGLLVTPLVVLALARRLRPIPPETMALALIATGNLIYMIPNSTMTPVGLLVFGAVAGFAIHGPQRRGAVPDAPGSVPRGVRYTRFASSGAPDPAPRPTARSARPATRTR